ncbi:MAG: hypothetical protein B6U97_04375 [Candidatus Altiarchaeales archaeon ex4484_96]|nr:MAG: hypothetical protein B6U97_04375 [Candidatus Altiarchaeales archaeon ex4484_96]
MHEYGIAKDVISHVLVEADRYKASEVKQIKLDVGPLAMVNKDQLMFCLKAVSKDTIAEGMSVELGSLPVEIICPEKHVFQIDKPIDDVFRFLTSLRCPICGDKASIKSGREIILKEITAI